MNRYIKMFENEMERSTPAKKVPYVSRRGERISKKEVNDILNAIDRINDIAENDFGDLLYKEAEKEADRWDKLQDELVEFFEWFKKKYEGELSLAHAIDEKWPDGAYAFTLADDIEQRRKYQYARSCILESLTKEGQIEAQRLVSVLLNIDAPRGVSVSSPKIGDFQCFFPADLDEDETRGAGEMLTVLCEFALTQNSGVLVRMYGGRKKDVVAGFMVTDGKFVPMPSLQIRAMCQMLPNGKTIKSDGFEKFVTIPIP